jgi:uncharacterized protein
MQILSVIFVLLMLFISGCVSTDKNNKKNNPVDHNQHFLELVKKFKKSSDSVTYEDFWRAYLKSDQVEETALKQEHYLELVKKIQNKELSCKDINWEEVTLKNFWSIKPHLYAQSCYEEMDNVELASFHESAVNFILSGILSKGSGKNYHTAYEVATLGDASDVIELTGYEVVDSYLELAHYGQALYYVYVVNDLETGLQKEIFFENNQFLHKILHIPYPFAALDNQLKNVVDFMAKTDSYAKIAKANILVAEHNYNDAVKMYLNAINDGSAIANFQLGILCHSKKQSILKQDECIDYIFQSAEMGYLNASILLAFIYKEGIEVEQDGKLSDEIMSNLDKRLEPGEAWYKFASFYKNAIGIDKPDEHKNYLNKATSLGSKAAEYESTLLALDEVDWKDPNQVESIMERLKTIAEKGLDSAQATYANTLLRLNEKGTEKWHEAKQWIEKSVAQNNPFANHLLGDSFQYGYFGEVNLSKAYEAYNEAASNYYPKSQLNVGYFHDIGNVVDVDKRLALSWYFLCSRAGNLSCIRNLGVYFREGIIVEQNYDIAFGHFKFSSDKGNIQSTTSLGLLYKHGYGVEKDINMANELFKKSCDLYDGEGCTNLGVSYKNGEGFDVDYKKANELYEKGCINDDSDGCNFLAISYEKGRGIELNYARAAELYEQSCEMGNAASCFNLGYMYKQGTGVNKNISKAKELYNKACIGGFNLGCLIFK